MWIDVTKEQFDYIAKTMRNLGKGYEWHNGDYTSIKLTMKDWEEHFPHYLIGKVN
jgi:hypothetical protein